MTLPILLAVLVALVAPATARAEVTIQEGTPRLGYVHLTASSTTASEVRIVESVEGDEVSVPVAPSGDGVEATVPWTCREARSFVAIAGEERTPPFTVQTPSCANRLKISTLSQVDVGDDLRVTLVDRWHRGGIEVDVCAGPRGADGDCRHVVMPAGSYAMHVLYRASRPGQWDIAATTSDSRVFRTVRVLRRRYRGGPRVLFTGDSMMLTPQRVLRRLLPRSIGTVDDIFVGSGITRPFVIDWAKLPALQVRTYRPDATVISLGMGDSRGLGDAPCCGEDWIAAYAERVRRIMRAYVRGGDGAVVWLNLPFSSNPELWPAEAGVNAAIARAAAGFTRVDVVDLHAIFTPDGAFHRYLFVDGQRTDTRIRTADGIHITRAGARIASRIVMNRLRSLGVVG